VVRLTKPLSRPPETGIAVLSILLLANASLEAAHHPGDALAGVMQRFPTISDSACLIILKADSLIFSRCRRHQA
jgi:hypothetical protein